MKYFCALPLMLLLLTSCGDEKKEETLDRDKTDWAFYKLKGDVKTVTQKSYTYIDGVKGESTRDDQGQPDNDLEFDDKGLLIKQKLYRIANIPMEETSFSGRDKIIQKTQYISDKPGLISQYQYDESGKINTSITRRNPDNTQFDRIETKLKDGKVSEKTTFNAQNNPIDIITYDYDKDGNLAGENMFLGIQSVQVQSKYKYDDKKRKIAETRSTHDQLNSTTLYEYDDNDHLISSITTDDKGEVEYTEKCGYDDKGNLRSQVTYRRADNAESVELYTYDKNNNMTEATVTEKGAVVMKAMFAYDKFNNLTSTKSTDAKGKTVNSRTYQYSYDSANNWNKKIISINGKQKLIVERTFTYHK
ncbi:hypothetical protein FMM05_12640 [Flavobacterium zepuense]|uniref:YD repeat-containing protein n=1 Tax=Flavobacterium zepuense TaxID=2593302 RepID=A0A552V0K3_9FLAO|nr:hypothetical protein [Flavobacterium zepuense]TRW23998.1 hypothetical protein FMM05_12640 [Flavobacterium zepuense]